VSTRSPIGKAVRALATFSVAAVLAVLATPLAFGAVSAETATAAAASGPCVAVIVDFRKLGGAVQTGCAQGDPSTGLKALTAAGFSYVPRARDGLICQINAKPACTETTTSNYWSYWNRAAGSSKWVYASAGAGSHNPKPGSTEGWVWQSGGRTPPPNTAANVICPQLAASPTPKPTKSKPAGPKPTGTANSSPGAGKTHSPSTGNATPGKPSVGSKSSAGASASATASSPTSSPTNSSTSPSPSYAVSSPPNGGGTGGAFPDPAADGGGGALGGAAGVALGGAVVLGIGAATVVRARRGRSP
jgi:hypothetical protein